MDIAMAIYLYDPSATYRLSHSNATKYSDILEWLGPSEMPDEETLQQLWDEYVYNEETLPPEPTLQERVFLLEEEVKKLKEKP